MRSSNPPLHVFVEVVGWEPVGLWILDSQIHVDAMNLGAAIKEGNKSSMQDCVKALIFLWHHLHEDLKSEKDPLTLWNEIKERYNH